MIRVATVLALFMALAICAAPAFAHDWYPWSCCSATDCWPTGEGQLEPDPTYTPQGWRLSDGVIVPFHQARPSPDGRFHVCRKGGQSAGALITPPAEPPCLWAPQQSF